LSAAEASYASGVSTAGAASGVSTAGAASGDSTAGAALRASRAADPNHSTAGADSGVSTAGAALQGRELPTPIKARLVLHRALQELLARAAARLVPLQAPEAQLPLAAGRMSRVAM